MNTKLVHVWWALFFVVVGCTRSPFEDDTDPKLGLLLSTSQVDYEPWLATAAGSVRLPRASKALQTNFQKSDAIGVFIYSGTTLPSVGAHSTNMRYFTQDGVPDGSTTAPIWTAATAMGGALVGGTAYQTTAYYPYNATSTDGTAIPHSVALDQTAAQATNGTAGVFELSDFLWAPSVAVVNPTSVPAATFVFQHLMARLQLEVDVPTIIDGVAVTKLNSLSIKNVHTQASINVGTGAVAVLPASGVVVPRALNKVTAAGQVATYEAILIPQTVPMGTIVVEMKCQTGAGEKVASYYPPAGGLPLESGKKITLRLTAPADIAFTQTPDLSVGAAVVDQVLKIKVAAGTTWTLTAPSTGTDNWLQVASSPDGAYGYTLTQPSTGSEQTVYVKAAQNTTANPREVRVNLTALIGGVNQTVAWTAVQNYNVPTVFPTTSFVFDNMAPYSFPSLAGNTLWYVKVDPTAWDGLRLSTRPKAWAELTAADTLAVAAAASTGAQRGVPIYGNYINTNGQLYLVCDPTKSVLTTIWCQDKATVVDTRSILVTNSDGTKLRWARGNLVASSAQGSAGLGGCKIGAPADGGLYFQFGSLIGYKGGNQANGGTGVGIPQAPLTTSGTYWNGSGFTWGSDAMVWPTELVGTKTTWTSKDAANVSTLSDYYFNYSVAPWATPEQNIRDFAVPISGDSGTGTLALGRYASKGVGDPCTYYLGEPWRLPTTGEYKAMCNNQGGYGVGGIAWGSCGASWTGTPVNGGNFSSNRLFFPASGFRYSPNGSFNSVTMGGSCWSSSVAYATSSLRLYFNDGGVSPQNSYNRSHGKPVRCVSSVP